MREYHCFRCKEVMPFLEEHEWKIISPLLTDSIRKIKEYRAEHQCDLATAQLNYNAEASIEFERITGYKGVHVGSIFHHRLKDMGPECVACGHLFRTNRASYCANCGGTVGKET